MLPPCRRWPHYSTFPLTDVTAPAAAPAGAQQAASPAAGATATPQRPPSATPSANPSRKPTPTSGIASDDDAAAVARSSAATAGRSSASPLQAPGQLQHPQEHPPAHNFFMPAAAALPRVPLSAAVGSLGAAASPSARGASPPPAAKASRLPDGAHGAEGSAAGAAASAQLERSALLVEHGDSSGLPQGTDGGGGGPAEGTSAAGVPGPVAEGADNGGAVRGTDAQAQAQHPQQEPQVLLGHLTLLSAFAQPPPSEVSAARAGPQPPITAGPNQRPPLPPARPHAQPADSTGTQHPLALQTSAQQPAAPPSSRRHLAGPPEGPADAAATVTSQRPLSPPPAANGSATALPHAAAAAAAVVGTTPPATPLPRASAAVPQPPPPAAAAPPSIVGVISRSVLLKLLEMRADLAAASSTAPRLATASTASSTCSDPAACQPAPTRGWWVWQRLLQPWRGYAPAAVAPAAGGAAAMPGAAAGGKGAVADSNKEGQRRQEPTEWLGGRRSAMSRQRAVRLLDAVDNYPAKVGAVRIGGEGRGREWGPVSAGPVRGVHVRYGGSRCLGELLTSARAARWHGVH